MFGNHPKNTEKKPQKIFSDCAKPYAATNLPFYIIDILLSNYMLSPLCPVPLTALEIQGEIMQRIRQYYTLTTIRKHISSLHQYSHTIAVHYTTKKVPRNAAKAFYISFKNPKQHA